MRFAWVVLLVLVACRDAAAPPAVTRTRTVIPGPCQVRMMWWVDTASTSTNPARIIISQSFTGVGDNPCPDSVWIERESP